MLSGRHGRSDSLRDGGNQDDSICVVAILKDEDPFVEEWVAYHRLLGADHFYLYDNDARLPLRDILARHAAYVTVVDWPVEHDDARFEGRTKQLKAYRHFLDHFARDWRWVAFIDGDEFIVLDRHQELRDFLRDFADFDSIALNWHVFGHSGYFDNPPGLITECLTRRMKEPRSMVKSISRTRSIAGLDSPHLCQLLPGCRRVDANKRLYREPIYPGKTDIAHINHYQCRSFKNWMSKPYRGEAGTSSQDRTNKWRFTEEGCLRQFVTEIAKDKNEYVDTGMLPWSQRIRDYLASLEGQTSSFA
jgi:hypothetical protein